MNNLSLAKHFVISIMVICFSLPAFSDNEGAYASGYLGARIGYSYNEESCFYTSITCDKNDAGYGVFAGYDFNRHVALELSFNDIGDSSAVYPVVSLDGKLREADLALKISYPLYKQTHIYGKFGAAYWDAEVTGGSYALSDSGVRPLVGGGVGFPFADHWAARVEYQYINQVGDDAMGYTNPHFLGVSLVWNFESRAHKPPVIPAAVVIAPAPAPIVKKEPEPEPAIVKRIVVDEQLGGPLFDFDQAIIRNTAAIDPVVALLMQTSALDVSIIGHTDARGSAEYNQRLSETRANVVAKYLRSKGVALDRIKVYGMGEDQPVANNETDEGRAKNRRVEFVISGAKTL